MLARIRLARTVVFLAAMFLSAASATAQEKLNVSEHIRRNYTRSDHTIAMRDGVKLYTIVYAPKDQSQQYPMLLTRTPYGIAPYDKSQMRSHMGPSDDFV